MRYNKNVKIGLLFLSIIFLIFGSVLLYFTLNDFQKGLDSQNWPTTNGVIIKSEIETDHNTGSRGSSTTYGADIEYSYSINGQVYTSNQVSFTDFSSSDINHAKNIVNKYSIGETITVYYNQENPNEAVLEPGITIVAILLPIIGFIFIIICFLILYFIFIRNKVIGNINIILDKKNYKPGEKITGKLELNLKKPITAESLTVAFKGEKYVRQRYYGRARSYSHSTLTFFEDKKELDGSREFYNENYTFQLIIPNDIIRKAEEWGEDGVGFYGNKKFQLGEKTKKLQNFSKQIVKASNLADITDIFLVEAQLNIRHKFDVKERFEIEILYEFNNF